MKENEYRQTCLLAEFGECGQTFITTKSARRKFCGRPHKDRYGKLKNQEKAQPQQPTDFEGKLRTVAEEFLGKYRPLPSVPVKIHAVRIEEMEFDTPQEAVSLFSDLHYYSRIDRRTTNGLAEYNIDIARDRLRRWRDGLLRFTQMSQILMTIDTLHMFSLGDELEGHGKMFGTQALQMSESLLFQVMGFVEDMTGVLLDLLTRYKKIIVYKVPGNHGRIAERARDAMDQDNAELLAWEIIGERIRSACGGEWKETENGIHSLTGGTIDIHIHRSFLAAARILGWLCVGRHGHGIKGIDVTYTGAIDNKYRMNSIIGEVINYYFKGHLHEEQSAEHEIAGETIQNGCFVGPSLLSLERSRAAANRPSQEFMLFHPKYGKTHQHRIHLATVDEMRHLEVIG